MRRYQIELSVVNNISLAGDAFMLELTDNSPLPEAVPGQFAELLVEGSVSTFLRRPISIHDIDRNANVIRFLIRKVGNGTEKLSKLGKGDNLNVLLPLGNGFNFTNPAPKHPLLVGGGVGIAPLFFLGKEMKDAGIEPTFLFGGRGKDNLLRMADFEKFGRVFVTTEDGSMGQKGFVTDHKLLIEETFDSIMACGPTPMMKAVARFANCKGVSCQVSLEHKMACGIGACLCCVEQTKEGNICVCKEGPVFTTDRLLWQN